MYPRCDSRADQLPDAAKARKGVDATEKNIMPAYAVAHLREVRMGDTIIEYLQRIDAEMR